MAIAMAIQPLGCVDQLPDSPLTSVWATLDTGNAVARYSIGN